MSDKFLSSNRVMLILLLLLVGAPFLLLNHQVRKRMKRKKLESDAGMIGSALMGYRRGRCDCARGFARCFAALAPRTALGGGARYNTPG
jgi:hypothetical protein